MMDLELRISQYIDGELSGEEEAELHHMLAVSPEARSLFREHLTLHTVARDERVLHRPAQVMRDDLFARLHAEEGMKPSAAVLASTAIVAAIPSNAGSRIADDRSPIASREDERAEERRRRRRLIPILIPLLLCVIVGGVWYSGGFDGSGGSEDYANVNIESKGKPSAAASGRDYTERTEIPDTDVNDETLALNGSASSPASERAAAPRQLDHSVSAPPPPPSMAAAIEPAHETLASADDASGGHDVLGIPSPPLQAARMRADASSELLADGLINSAEQDENNTPLGGYSVNEDRSFSFDLAARDFEESYPPLEEGMGINLTPESISSLTSSREGFVSRDADFSGSTDPVRSNDLARVDGVDISDPISVTMSNSIGLPTDFDGAYRSGRLLDSTTGLPVRAMVEDKEAIAAALERSGFNVGMDSEPMTLEGGVGGINTGNRAMNENWSGLNSNVEMNEDGKANLLAVSEEKGKEAPIVMGSTLSDRNKSELRAKQASSDTVQILSMAEDYDGSEDLAVQTSSLRSYKSSAALESAPLEPSTPRRLSFFVGLDQSLGATVTAVEASIPFPASSFSSFSDNGGLYSETRAVVGIEFDNGRQRVFAAVGSWGYDERESFRSRISNGGPVNTVITTIREEERTSYEFWGGAGYRYSIEVTRDWNAGAEVWGGIGGNFVHAGFALPVSYELKDNLRLEIIPGVRYREMHNTAVPVTTGTSDGYEERLVTPRDKRHVQATAGIGLILLLH